MLVKIQNYVIDISSVLYVKATPKMIYIRFKQQDCDVELHSPDPKKFLDEIMEKQQAIPIGE
jgi:hypothetical protein